MDAFPRDMASLDRYYLGGRAPAAAAAAAAAAPSSDELLIAAADAAVANISAIDAIVCLS